MLPGWQKMSRFTITGGDVTANDGGTRRQGVAWQG
jgi:hypothetical protein